MNTQLGDEVEALVKSRVEKLYEVYGDHEPLVSCAVFVLPAGSSADARGVLSVTEDLFPAARLITVLSGDKPDMAFKRFDDMGWVAQDMRIL